MLTYNFIKYLTAFLKITYSNRTFLKSQTKTDRHTHMRVYKYNSQ